MHNLARNLVVEELFIMSLNAYPEGIIPGQTGPTVIGFDLGLNSNTLVIEFNEPIVTNFQFHAVIIQDAFNATLSHTLSFFSDVVMDNQ